MKRKMPVVSHSSKRTHSSMFLFARRRSAHENDRSCSWCARKWSPVSQSVELSHFFSRSVSPTILEPITGLFRDRLSTKICTRQSRNVLWDIINLLFLTYRSCRTYFCCFLLAFANKCPWPLVPFFQISSKNSELKTTHNTFRDCRVHFFRQPFWK